MLAERTPITIPRLEPILTSSTLEELGVIVEKENRAAQSAIASSLLHAIRAGCALTEARSRVPEGEWYAWLKPRGVNEARAAEFMRLAHYRDDLLTDETSGLDVRRALLYLRGMPAVGRFGGEGLINHERRLEVRRLRDEGFSHDQIAERLGMGKTSVYEYLLSDVDRKRRMKRRDLRRRRSIRSKRLAEQLAANLAAVRQRGGSIERAYQNTRLALQELQAVLPSTSGEERKAIEDALQGAYVVEDSIGRALRSRVVPA